MTTMLGGVLLRETFASVFDRTAVALPRRSAGWRRRPHAELRSGSQAVSEPATGMPMGLNAVVAENGAVSVCAIGGSAQGSASRASASVVAR